MQKISGLAVASLLLLSGCAKQEPVKSLVTPPETSQPVLSTQPQTAQNVSSDATDQGIDNQSGHVQQCRKELDAMRMYSKASYDAYLAEFQTVNAKTQKYLNVKDSIGVDINDLVMPRYQFQMRELCFRIKNRLAQLIIRQAS